MKAEGIELALVEVNLLVEEILGERADRRTCPVEQLCPVEVEVGILGAGKDSRFAELSWPVGEVSLVNNDQSKMIKTQSPKDTFIKEEEE